MEKINPEGDLRYREHRSVVCWVLEKHPVKGELRALEIIDSIERVLFWFEGKPGRFVRYRNFYHPVHGADILQSYLDLAVKDEFHVFSNELGVSNFIENIHTLNSASFIFWHEKEFPA